ncbi:profilin-1 [Pempheris klunzingeri]|uniref:profilin-1 n=1 Tax=Pempheris klunzingeri TaxID=3127111 RepID=UPI003980B9C4
MSWESYIGNLLKNGLVSEAAICGMETGSEGVWASTPGLAGITADEIKRLAGDTASFHTSGPLLAGTKCMFLRDGSNDPSTYSLDLKTKADSEGVSYSVCVGKSKKTLVIAKGKKDVGGGPLSMNVHSMVKYLRDQNY